MKNVLSILTIAILFIATSCSKESKLNRKLDGKWVVTSQDGVAATGDETSYTFTKDKKVGTVVVSSGGFGITGSYTLIDDKTIVMTYTIMGSTSTSNVTVQDYSKTTLTIKDEDGTVTVLTKK